MADETLEILKASQIPSNVLLRHLRLDPDYVDDLEMQSVSAAYDAALSYVYERCGIDAAYADEHPDIAIAVLVLARDMYDNRSLYVDKSNVNRAAESILSCHDFNLI
ncbi:head-tail connector protein [Gordonibacter urolithinfaciens]|uniref:Phage gp6-like head-tail connector protein n=1 Tax=Gordonibacter urolithinfaciens TaxID=1335613 RepID=A0A6N8IGL8_9ACTN|nr:phage gp6-like head-tail connector protein [Gordonibacter urolithinfaciens]MVN14978.1 phage gp6-like head-tail connector protein [Gordonibacter urolithinfaciens]MVN38487.1 phage gp6-like head-tail connector protein [Gordonibacter urolithinfaciens]MVN55145.1 phage gp6-like head-tail connector protein [Gordonibacter urolithinfaciens]MVN60613.1 phage gp6-like head-tail connector protein [Gordonibacter urolithinfaciens]